MEWYRDGSDRVSVIVHLSQRTRRNVGTDSHAVRELIPLAISNTSRIETGAIRWLSDGYRMKMKMKK